MSLAWDSARLPIIRKQFRVSSFLCWCIALFPIPLAGTPALEVMASSTVVRFSESMELTFTLYNANDGIFNAPDFSDFEILSGPYIQLSTDIQHGKARTSKSFVYVLRPKRVGELLIGSASAVATGGIQLNTHPLKIRAFSSNVTPRGSAFAEARLTATNAYPGQPLWLELIVFFADSAWTVQATSTPDMPGFVSARCNETAKGYALIDGRTWFTSTERIRLLPQQSGNFILPAFRFDIMEWRGDPYSPFGHNVKREEVTTPPIKLSVSAIQGEEGHDSSVSTGRWTLHAEWPQAEAAKGDPLFLHIVMEGEGDPKRMQAPRLLLPEGLTAFPPRILEKTTEDPCRDLKTVITYHYPLVAKDTGRFSVEVSYNYFDTYTHDFVTLSIKTSEIVVKEVSGKHDSMTSAKQTNPPSIRKMILIGCLTLVFAVSGWMLQQRRKSATQITEEIHEPDRPQAHLLPCLQPLKHRDVDAFFKILSEVMFEALSRKMGHAVSRTDIARMKQGIASAEPNMQKLMRILEMADYSRYSGEASRQESLEDWYNLALEVLIEFDQGG